MIGGYRPDFALNCLCISHAHSPACFICCMGGRVTLIPPQPPLPSTQTTQTRRHLHETPSLGPGRDFLVPVRERWVPVSSKYVANALHQLPLIPSLSMVMGPGPTRIHPLLLIFSFRRMLSPFATCPHCDQGDPITVTSCARATPSFPTDQMTSTAKHNQHPSSRSKVADSQEPGVTLESSRTRGPVTQAGRPRSDFSPVKLIC